METVALRGGVEQLSASSHGQQIPPAYETVPTIDLQRLKSHDQEERSEAITDLGRACEEWGFFHLINHGVPENLRLRMLAAGRKFFDLPSPEKLKHAHRKTCARSVMEEYSMLVREITGELLAGISESLGLGRPYLDREVRWDKGLQVIVINFYPRRPQPELAPGIPPHSDHGLFTILAQNEVDGLQVKHGGNWVPVTPLPGSFLVNVGDHLEILTNGKYKSVEHRATVNGNKERTSVAAAHGPCLDTVVTPAILLMNQGGDPLQYRKMTCREYVEVQQSNRLRGKACSNVVKV
ncbi:unnamed protein product [Victoria cruziana]